MKHVHSYIRRIGYGATLAGLVIISTSIVSLIGCSVRESLDQDQIVVVLQSEPDRLHPILSRSKTATQIENMIFTPLAEYDPSTLELEPLMIDQIPEPLYDSLSTTGRVLRLDINLRDSMQWSDGTPITAQDLLFTYKCLFNPEVAASRFRQELAFIRHFRIDENDPHYLAIYLDTNAIDEVHKVLNLFIYPEHVYDTSGLMYEISISSLLTGEIQSSDRDKLKEFARRFDSEYYNRERVVGNGPYTLESWTTAYEIRLTKQAGWWGNAYSERSSLFKAHPSQIIYKFIPDQQLAITALATGNADIVSNIDAEKFRVMQETSPDQYQYLTTIVPQYYYIILNNESPLLNDVQVRRALSLLVDQPHMIQVLMSGYAYALSGPMLPGSPYYDTTIRPYSYDLDSAQHLLSDAGWEDSDEDGIRDKVINDRKYDLKMRLYITGGETGRKLALVLQNQMKPAGVAIDIVVQKWNPHTMDDMKRGNFEMVASSSTQTLGPPLLKGSWHSQGKVAGGNNFSRFDDPQTDRLIDSLDVIRDSEKRIEVYHAIHKRIHEEAPVLFLMMPKQLILVSNKWNAVLSTRRPGYFEQLFTLKSE